MSLILALYPNARGIDYACVELPKTVLDHGLIKPLPFCTKRLMQRVERFITYFQPTIVVLRGLELGKLKENNARKLIEAIIELGKERGLPVYSYTRKQIKDCFETHEAQTKHEIAQKIISWLPSLSSYAPKVRKLWLPEDHKMGIFDAVALAITHAHFTS
jgi:Holliday junction resolvasome RuvABC endonuclease subunit